MSNYDTIITVAPTVDLSNAGTCIPATDFLQFCQLIVFKTDAIKLGVLCFIAGIAFWMFIIWLDQRWKN
jgi:hypothetical protein